MNRKNIEDNKRATINFAIIQNNIEDSVPQLIENENKTGGYIDFGKDNKFPSKKRFNEQYYRYFCRLYHG